MTGRFRVADGVQVLHEGRLYGPGETFEADERQVAVEVRAGWLVPAVETKPAPRAGRKAG